MCFAGDACQSQPTCLTSDTGDFQRDVDARVGGTHHHDPLPCKRRRVAVVVRMHEEPLVALRRHVGVARTRIVAVANHDRVKHRCLVRVVFGAGGTPTCGERPTRARAHWSGPWQPPQGRHARAKVDVGQQVVLLGVCAQVCLHLCTVNREGGDVCTSRCVTHTPLGGRSSGARRQTCLAWLPEQTVGRERT